MALQLAGRGWRAVSAAACRPVVATLFGGPLSAHPGARAERARTLTLDLAPAGAAVAGGCRAQQLSVVRSMASGFRPLRLVRTFATDKTEALAKQAAAQAAAQATAQAADQAARQASDRASDQAKTGAHTAAAAANSAKLPSSFREDIYTVPNILTASRLAVTPVIAYLLLHQDYTWSLGLFMYAAVTDAVDGYIARKWNLQSVVGSVIDPMADKFLMVTLTGCLAYTGGLPIWLAVIILGRDILLGISAIYYRYISLPPPKTFKRYWDFSLPSAEVHPTTISKYNTVLQMGLVALCVVEPVALTYMEPAMASAFRTGMTGLEYTVATTTVLSGLSYVFSKNAVKILKPGEMDARQKK
ncbi:CDP-alcohol phosphatidyltransferase-domain-containing protein [Dipodascopsis tothii]|uniref:CDP-alcohol phosphatidyltransferase-domain-containing protein n=1 Tax=Dipodascopsis tothii TaxID=44089 RepID=UPI0034CD8173